MKIYRRERLLGLLSLAVFLITDFQGANNCWTSDLLAGEDTRHSSVVASGDHPRFFFNANEITALRNKTTSTHQEIWQPIKDYVDSELGSAPPAVAPVDGSLSTYRNYGNMLMPFALAAALTKDMNYINLTKTYLLGFADWDQWDENGYRDLGLAHMLLGHTLAYDWLYQYFTPEEKNIIRQSIADWAQKMYDASSGPREIDWGNWWRKSYTQNHHWTNNCALGMAGLALLGEDPRAQTWIDQAVNEIKKMQHLLNGIDDGSWHEGIHYQSYGMTLFLPFLINLRNIQGVDLFPENYLRNYVDWRIYNHLNTTSRKRRILSYGNFKWSWGEGYRSQNILRFLANEFDNGHAEWMAQQLIPDDGRDANVWATPWFVLEFLYYDATIGAQEPTNFAKSRIFPDLESVIWRTGWGEDELVFGLKSGAHGGRFAFNSFVNESYPWDVPCEDTGCQINIGHDHDDMNGFYIYRSGQWLAEEVVGVGRTLTSFHNTMLIDGQGQYRAPKSLERPCGFP